MLKQKTLDYISFFAKKDLSGLSLLLDESFALEDPIVKRVEGKTKALIEINNIFTSCEKLDFIAKNIYVVPPVTIIEFKLILDETILEGVDILEWREGQLVERRAYLDVPK